MDSSSRLKFDAVKLDNVEDKRYFLVNWRKSPFFSIVNTEAPPVPTLCRCTTLIPPIPIANGDRYTV